MTSLNSSLLTPHTDREYLERRREARLPTHIPSLLLQKGRVIYTTITNLSANGIGFLSAVPLEVDDQIQITFECLDLNTMVPVNLDVKVHICEEVELEFYIGGHLAQKSTQYIKFFTAIS
ncbi:PilZ domain-containing protein [Thiomicrorhabdus aquaedulcis]|uniref:PilZ domain-containing protein n=1 Tax=Thiomicrorhabdus aquaedulcis TaxID=2211106 RepID=UPI000FDC5624|nr:PilZ domain-containing protein [Thiomicrorhabdus aquaedulcis]